MPEERDLFPDWPDKQASPDPPSQQHSPTSQEAAEQIKPGAQTLRQAVLQCLIDAGEDGLTDEEIADKLGMSGNTERPRRVELLGNVKSGLPALVRDSGKTRKTRSGRNAVVWVVIAKKE